MADLDELRIRINADSGNAIRSIDNLTKKLTTLSTALTSLNVSGLDNLSRSVGNLNTAMNGLNGNTLDPKVFTQLARNINKLGRLNSSQIGSIGNSITSLTGSLQSLASIDVTDSALRITELANAISRLGGANATRAVDTIPLLSSALQQMMISLSNAPYVSDNVVSLASSMATLATQGRNIQNSTAGIVTNFNNTGHAARALRPRITGLASAFGRFYASCFLAIRAVKGLWGAIEKSMNYIEVLNYFDAAMEQLVSHADLSKWEELGYESAEAYAQSFGKGIQELSEKMTGYTQDASGKLVQMNGAKSLGINATDLMNASTNFTQIASSMGVASQNAETLSVVLTELGADIASVKNQDFTTVWQKLQSGLVGMSRAVDQYGINIRNANLQTELANIGIETSVSNFGQQEKALLRVIVMLKNTEFAYGDLADTIKQPANQVRMLKASFENFSRSLGSIFLPIVAKVIPYLITLTNALVRLNEYIVNLLGFADFDWGGASSGVSDIVSDALDAEDALDDATGAANKLKKALQGFDELNNLTSSDSGGGGAIVSAEDLAKLQDAFDAAVAEYQKRWDEAFDNMAETYNRFADDIADAFNRGGAKEVGQVIAQKIVNSLSSINWNKIKGGVSTFFTNMAQFFNGFINPELFSKVGETLAESINTVLLAIFTIGNETDFDNIGTSLTDGINTFFDTFDWALAADTLDAWVQGLAKAIKAALGNLDWSKALEGIGEFIGNIDFDTVSVVIKGFTIVAGANVLMGAIQGAIQGLLSNVYIQRIGVTLGSIVFAWEAGTFIGNELGQAISEALGDYDALDDYVNFNWSDALSTWFADDSFGDWWYNTFYGATDEMVKGIMDGNKAAWLTLVGMGNYWEAIQISSDILFGEDGEEGLWAKAFQPDIDKLKENIKNAFSGNWTEIDLDYDTPLFQFFVELGEFWADGMTSAWNDVSDWWENTVMPFWSGIGTSLWTTLRDGLNPLITLVEDFINKIIDGFNSIADIKIEFPQAIQQATGYSGFTFSLPDIKPVSLKKLAEGGIVSSSTIANIGEAGKEAVLPLERNTEWMDMLAQRLVASMNVNESSSYTFVAELDGNTIFEETVRQADMWKASTGRNAFA